MLIISGKKQEWFKTIKYNCNIIIIDSENLKNNTIIKKVLNSYEDYLAEKNNILIDDNYFSFFNLKNNISFALGAGCSIDSNISDWNRLSEILGFELLYSIVNTKDSVYKNMFITNELNKKIFSCYEKKSALDVIYQSYITSPSLNEFDYFSTIKRALYMMYNSPDDANTKLMDSINGCIVRKKMKSIISYNFDSVLEQNYNNYYKSTKKEIENAKTKIGMCDVYHVHGFIPYDYDEKTFVTNLVFTDKEYYENMINTSNNCNSIQREILLNNNIIFVGVSFTDENLKMLLRERMSCKYHNEIYGFIKLPEFDVNDRESLLIKNKYKMIQETYFRSLGVKILWIDDYTEIPEKIDLLK